VTKRVKAGHAYYYRQFYGASGQKRDEYLGPVGTGGGALENGAS
jgi:hypothetical protein